ncbi:MAG: hypothetical protein RMJ36_01120 [Candidatus Calescibacterium sp.]|nr:hypothetical protein [Candidatus Calescibacterium sp.]MDW8132241.1 hypothetical protein [Candidatus Calescibacterium sp.]
MAVAEIYKETERKRGRYQINLGGIRYNLEYEITNLSGTDIIVDLKKGRHLVARGMIRIRERFDKFAFITGKNQINLIAGNYYSSGWLLGQRISIEGDIDVNKKPLSLVMIREDTIVNGKGSNNMENVKELEKYADFVSYGDNRHVLMSYYNQLYDELYNQTRDYRGMERFYNVSGLPANHPHNFIRLTPSGILYIGRNNSYKNIALQLYGNSSYNSISQNIRIIGVSNNDSLVDLGEFNFYSNVSKTVNYGTILISNDPELWKL